MTVKVGQVYKSTSEDHDWRFVITHISDGGWIDYIYEDGVVIADNCEDEVLDGAELLAEYPTWFEAIHSPFFTRAINKLGRM